MLITYDFRLGGTLGGRRNGIALITVLLFSAVLLIMVLAMFSALRGRLFISRDYHDRAAALYLAEAGLEDALKQLEADPNWTVGFTAKSLPGMEGTYTVTFNTGGAPFGKNESINNNDGTHPDSYRGNATVPTGACLLVVTAQVGSQERTLEALVRVSGGSYPAYNPISGNGHIVMRGNVAVDGIKALDDPTPVDADIHSNLDVAGSDLIKWDDLGGTATASIAGEVSISSPDSTAISSNLQNLVTTGQVKSVKIKASKQTIPDVDILARIAAKSGAPAPSIVSGGATVLSGGGATPADYYYSGDLTINGDLVLDKANLYVDGKLTVNGSITGEGSVYVAGDTSFQGTAAITTASPDKVALYSQGNVDLLGFDGTAYLNSISDPAFQTAWHDFQVSMTDWKVELNKPNAATKFFQDSLLDRIKTEIGGGQAGYVGQVRPGHPKDSAGTMIARLQSQPPGATRDFMIDRIQDLKDIFFYYGNSTPEEINALNNFANNTLVKGAFDAAIDNGRTDLLGLMQSYTDQIDLNRMGSSFFQGLIFTHGSFRAENEVSVVGALVALDDGSQAPRTVTSGGTSVTLNPGDIYLDNGVRVTYVQDFFQDSSGGAGGGPGVILWMGR